MNLKSIAIALILALFLTKAFGQNPDHSSEISLKDSDRDFKFSLNTTFHSFLNFGDEKTNTHHYELHFRYKLTQKDKIGIKIATWKLFAPMGIPLWDPLFLKESEFYPGRLREDGIGLTYQRMIWKGLFATIEVLPALHLIHYPKRK